MGGVWDQVVNNVLISTVELCYSEEDLGTMKITLLYQVSCYIGVKTMKYKELGPAKLPCYNGVLLYLTSSSQAKNYCNCIMFSKVPIIFMACTIIGPHFWFTTVL